MIQDMRGKQELGGPDVIVAHRMMKNQVKEKTGVKAYTLLTDAAVQQLGLQGMCIQMQAHTETYEHIGEVEMWVYDLKAAWERQRARNPVLVKQDEAWFTFDADFTIPPAFVWDYLTKPEYQQRWMQVDGVYVTNLNKGRVGAGSVNHCAHGNGEETLLTVLDWHPFDYVTLDTGFPMHMHALVTTHVQTAPNGTRVTWAFSKPTGRDAYGKVAAVVMQGKMKQVLQQVYSRGAEIIRQMSEEAGLVKTLTAMP
jgi:hypothetical protein